MSNEAEMEIQRLRDALEASGEGASIDDETIRSAVAGELRGDQTGRLAVEALGSPDAILSWRLARELAADATASEATLAPEPSRTSTSWQRWGLAAAAAIVLAMVGLQTIGPRVPDAEPAFRADADSPIASLLDVDAALPRDAFELAWSGPEGGRYEVTVSTLDLRVLHVARDLEATTLLVPESALAEIAAGEVIVWQVAGRSAAGDPLRSRTFKQRLE